MNTNQQTFRIPMTAIERQQGRLMRGPDHPGGDAGGNTGGTQEANQNNQGGNSGDSGQGSQNQNNSGTGFDPETFYSSSGEGTGTGNGESAPDSSSGQQDGQEQNPGDSFRQTLETLSFGNEVFSREAIEALAESRDPAALNTNLQTFGREVTRQSFLMSARLLQSFAPQLLAQVRDELRGEFGNRENDAELVTAIPSAKNPAIMATVQPIFKRALEITKGNRGQAIEMTKEMLKFQRTQLSGDLGINEPPADASDNMVSNVNWVDELLGRSGQN